MSREDLSNSYERIFYGLFVRICKHRGGEENDI
jgi:hypothetical protein